MKTAASRNEPARPQHIANDNDKYGMGLDQYYTNPAVAEYCFNLLRHRLDGHLMIEPSAGTGSFFKLMPKGSLGYDLEPKCAGVELRDFFTVEIKTDRLVAVVGNPPFGKNASTAIRFFNHAASMADVIAFIVPRTFRKASVQNRLDRHFHLAHDEVVTKNAFIYEGETYDVPCAFQIWERRETLRSLWPVETSHEDFAFTSADKADFALQRVGVNAGRVKLDLTVSAQSHYFIAGPVIETMRSIDFDSVRHDTAGNPSIAKSEIVALYREWTAAAKIAA